MLRIIATTTKANKNIGSGIKATGIEATTNTDRILHTYNKIDKILSEIAIDDLFDPIYNICAGALMAKWVSDRIVHRNGDENHLISFNLHEYLEKYRIISMFHVPQFNDFENDPHDTLIYCNNTINLRNCDISSSTWLINQRHRRHCMCVCRGVEIKQKHKMASNY